MRLYWDLSGGTGLFDEAMQYFADKEVRKKIFKKIAQVATKISRYSDGSIYCVTVEDKKLEEIEEIKEVLDILRAVNQQGTNIHGFEVVAKVSRFSYYYILKKDDSYYLVRDIIGFMKDAEVRQKVTETQKIKKIICNTIYLTNRKTVKFWFTKFGDDVIDRLRQKTKNRLLEAAVKLGEGADLADNEIFYDVEEVLEYRETTPHGKGLHAGLGFPGEATAEIVARKEDGEVITIHEEVKSYMEGYVVNRFVRR